MKSFRFGASLSFGIEVFRLLSFAGVVISMSPPLCANSRFGEGFQLKGDIVSGGGILGSQSFAAQSVFAGGWVGILIGGGFELSEGWINEMTTPGGIAIEVTRTADGRVKLSWPATAIEYVLESALNLDNITKWTPVVPSRGTNGYSFSIDSHTQFFRLRKP
jgi:hypothetical protein